MNTNQPADSITTKEIVFQLPEKYLNFIYKLQEMNTRIQEALQYENNIFKAMASEIDQGDFLQAQEICDQLRESDSSLQEILNNVSRSIGMIIAQSIANHAFEKLD